MNKTVFILLLNLLLCGASAIAQEEQKSALQERAEAEGGKGNVAGTRFSYIRAFEDYVGKGQMRQGVECGVKATALYYKENYYKEAFDLLRRIDQRIEAGGVKTAAGKATLHYLTTRERFRMYMKLRKGASAQEQLGVMEGQATAADDKSLADDLLYNKVLYYYTFGQNAKGNAVFKEMADKMTAQKEYDKVDDVYKTLIANGRKSNNATLVAQSYGSYMVWKDSVSALKHADEVAQLKQQIAEGEAAIADRDSSLSIRRAVIVGLGILVAALAAALVLGAIVLLRYVVLTRKQKNTIKTVNENNALKAHFISNISAQLEPTLRKLDGSVPEVQALRDFAGHIQTLSELERTPDTEVELEDTQLAPFCERMMDGIRDKVAGGVTLTVNAPKMSARLNTEYVSHILRHLLDNAARYTPADGHISLEAKKRGARTYQFLVSDMGEGIPAEKRDDVFKPFLEIRELTDGDGLGLPICKQMALKMGGDLTVDPAYVKGARFVLDLHV